MSEFGDTYEERAQNAETAVSILRSRVAELEGLLREAREKVAYMASGMTHAGWVTLDAQKTLARIDAHLARNSHHE